MFKLSKNCNSNDFKKMNVLLKYRTQLSVGVLVIFYSVGLVGILGEGGQEFANLTPLNLMLSALILWLNHEHWSKKVVLGILFAALVGFGIEVLGVKTGKIFGVYEYGNALGFKFFEVPLTIGLNWAMLAYSSAVVVKKLSKNTVVRSAIGASIMVLLDVLIEPVAIQFDFWSWQSDTIPLQNYLAWWLISFGVLYAINHYNKWLENKLAIVLLLTQFAFFGVLNLFM